ncbi:MAG: hypothetical protein A2Y91_06550 [Chloroflexi bacterium RBG_13_54_8]|nr:MAG: hypothetical protein A2Y91_06550 [Chloroflexi bacterium RBG_13_54_8]
MNHKAARYAIVLSLMSMVILSLLLVLFSPFERKVSADDLRHYIDSLDGGSADPATMKERAHELATHLFKGSAECSRFADEVVQVYSETQGIDFLLIYNTGGFGGSTMANDPEWSSILEGIRAELANLGYSSVIVEHQRSGKGLTDFLKETQDTQRNYRAKAPVLAAKVALLTKHNSQLKVIVTGRCFGGMISNEVTKLDAGNPRLYSIQASLPFWYTDSGLERSLIIRGNGVEPDIVGSRGYLDFLWKLARANVGRLPSSSPPKGGSFRAWRWYLKAPGHIYTWDYPGVRTSVVAFLEQNFGRKN